MADHLVFMCALNLLKKTNEDLLYRFFAKHHIQKIETDFKVPAKINRKKITKRPKTSLKTEFNFIKKVPRVDARSWKWSWESGKRESR